MSMTELGRVLPTDGAKLKVALDPGIETLIVENALSAVIYAAYGREPSTIDWDFVIPGSAMFTIPAKGGESTLQLLVDYSGAVPATDVQAIVWAAGCRWPPFVGAIV